MQTPPTRGRELKCDLERPVAVLAGRPHAGGRELKFAQAVDGVGAVLHLRAEAKTVADSQERSKGKDLKRSPAIFCRKG